MRDFASMTTDELLRPEGHACAACGRTHKTGLRKLLLQAGALNEVPRMLVEAGFHKPFLASDAHTDAVAGMRVRRLLEQRGIPHASYVFPEGPKLLEPDERAVGALCMAFDPGCDVVVAIGSGVVNDCCKVLAQTARVPSVAVATAPSMDGYASDSASMIQNHMKVSLYNACPAIIVADTDILAAAPEDMLRAGLGDMLAKYLSICEWRISSLVTGEYYCENIAGLMRASLKRLREHAQGLMRREVEAVKRVMEGLVLSGVAMSFAQVSRPASGLEHYFSHIWEMKALRGECPSSLHGVQVGVGSCLALKLYEHIRAFRPNQAKALRKMADFSQPRWEESVRSIFGEETAKVVIALEARERKNDPAKHAFRLERLIRHWEEIQNIIAEELPTEGELTALMRPFGMATTPEELRLTHKDAVDALLGSREIRDKYLTSSMLWDLGELEEFAQFL